MLKSINSFKIRLLAHDRQWLLIICKVDANICRNQETPWVKHAHSNPPVLLLLQTFHVLSSANVQGENISRSHCSGWWRKTIQRRKRVCDVPRLKHTLLLDLLSLVCSLHHSQRASTSQGQWAVGGSSSADISEKYGSHKTTSRHAAQLPPHYHAVSTRHELWL